MLWARRTARKKNLTFAGSCCGFPHGLLNDMKKGFGLGRHGQDPASSCRSLRPDPISRVPSSNSQAAETREVKDRGLPQELLTAPLKGLTPTSLPGFQKICHHCMDILERTGSLRTPFPKFPRFGASGSHLRPLLIGPPVRHFQRFMGSLGLGGGHARPRRNPP